MEILAAIFTPTVIIALLLLLAIFADYKSERGWAVFLGLAVLGVLVGTAGITINTVLITAAAWIPIGIVWSIWRWSRFCDKVVQDINENGNAKSAEHRLSFSRNSAIITYWVLFWPVSLVSTACEDVFDVIEKLMTKFFTHTFDKISKRALSKLA